MRSGKMLGKTQLPYKLLRGMAPCNCPDCRQDMWGYNTGNERKVERRALRRVNKREWQKELANPEFND